MLITTIDIHCNPMCYGYLIVDTITLRLTFPLTRCATLLLCKYRCATTCTAQVEAQLQRDREEKARRREEVELRINANLRMATEAEESRKSNFYSKKEAHDAHRASMLAERARGQSLAGQYTRSMVYAATCSCTHRDTRTGGRLIKHTGV